MGKRQLYHFIPEEETFEKRLSIRLENCDMAMLASAFFTFGAFESLKPSLEIALSRNAKITFLVGRFDFVTEPKAVMGLLHFSAKYPDNISVHFDSDFAFHFKLAVFRQRKQKAVIIGSSNLTPKGLNSIGEVNLEIIGNESVFTQAVDLLKHRLQNAIPASESIEEYADAFNRAKKFRQQRRRWENNGQKRFTKKHRSIPSPRLEGEKYVFCWIEGTITDKRLRRNIRQEHSNATKAGNPIPWQHVQWGSRTDAKIFKDVDVFFVRDDTRKCFGFAQAIKKTFLLGENDSEEFVIFYRYIRGQKVTFPTRQKYDKALERLKLNRGLRFIKPTTARRLEKFFGTRR